SALRSWSARTRASRSSWPRRSWITASTRRRSRETTEPAKEAGGSEARDGEAQGQRAARLPGAGPAALQPALRGAPAGSGRGPGEAPARALLQRLAAVRGRLSLCADQAAA